MKRLEFNDIYEVMDVMSESLDNLCDSDLYPVITAYGKYDKIKKNVASWWPHRAEREAIIVSGELQVTL